MNMSPLDFAANWAWQTSLAALPLIALMLAAALLLRKAMFTPLRYTLGLLVVVRLLMPISPSSPFSIQNVLNRNDSPQTTVNPEAVIQLESPVVPITAIPERI